MLIPNSAFMGLSCAIGCIASCFLSAQRSVQVTNFLDFPRNEVAAIPVAQLHLFLNTHSENELRIKDAKGKWLPIQWIDNDGDGKNDELLFPVAIGSGKTNTYSVVADGNVHIPESRISTYSRLVPERVDDYAWENDRVAFRVYGPKGQQEALQGIKSSTLSSGVDIWLKRTDLPRN